MIEWRESESGYWEAQTGPRWLAVLRCPDGRFAYFTGGHGSGYAQTLEAAQASSEATVGQEKPRAVALPAGMSSSLATGSGYWERAQRGDVPLGPLFAKRGAA